MLGSSCAVLRDKFQVTKNREEEGESQTQRKDREIEESDIQACRCLLEPQ